MKLHDRIMAMSEHGVDEEWPDYDSAIRGAAQLATEADTLMVEMAEAAQNMLDVMDGKGGTKPNAPELLRSALKNYQEFAQ